MAGRQFCRKRIFRFFDSAKHFCDAVRVIAPITAICGFFLIEAPASALAQRNAPAKDANEPADDLQRLPSDRRISQQLHELTRQARAGRLSMIRDLLQVLQAAEPSLMVPDGSGIFRPLHRELTERIQAFSPELQTEIFKDAAAKTPLLRTVSDTDGPAAVVRFLHRHAGSAESMKAHLLLAAIHRDRGYRQATLYWLSPVLHASAPADLRQVAQAMLAELNTSVTPQTDTEPQPHSDPDSRPDQERADTPPVDPSGGDINGEPGNGPAPESARQSAEAAPTATTIDVSSPDKKTVTGTTSRLSQAWQQTLHLTSAQHRATAELVRLLAADPDQPAIAWMAGEPIVDTQAVYVRSSEGLIAMDRVTGKIRWSRLFDRQTDGRGSIDARRAIPDDSNRSPLDAANLQNSPVIMELHRDAVTTRMTSDDLRLFAVCDTGETPAGSFELEPFHRLQRRGNLLASSMRELIAIEKSTGRRLWSVGGAPLEEQFGNELSRAWFAGPPAVFGNQLFGLVEQDDAHWLVCLQCETGEVVWKLMIAFPETDIFQDPSRQLDASLPLVADGVIWTRTNDGWLIAVDALTRSVIWTRRMTSGQPGTSRVRNLRGGQILLQPRPPFLECWRPEEMHLKSDTLLVTGPEGHQLLMLNPLTGSVRRRTSPEAANLILWVDDESILVGGPQKIQRLQRDNFDVVWATRLTATGVVPTGPGTRLDDHLLVPLSDGSLEVIRYSDGQLTENIPGLRPEFSTGGLKRVADEVVSYGPDHIGLLSRSSTAAPHAPDPIQQARELVAAGQFAGAQEILAGFTPTSDQAEMTRQLLYRAAIALTLKDTANCNEHLQHAARHARSSLENAVVLFLTFETKTEISADQIVEFLSAAPDVLHIELPDREEIRTQLISPIAADPFMRSGTNSVSGFHPVQPLRRFFLRVLEQHLVPAEPSVSAPWIAALKQISDEDLLFIGRNAPAVRDELLRRANEAIEADSPAETTLHLLLQAQQCQNQIRLDGSALSAADVAATDVEQNISETLDRFVRCLAENAVRADLPLKPHPAALNLLDVLQSELFPIREAQKSPDPTRVLAEQWSTWKDQSYTAVPVNPVTTGTLLQRNKRRLLPSCREDRFLSAWDWSTLIDPSVLTVRSLLRSTEPLFTIDGGMFDSLSAGEDGTILRCGSVLLVRNPNGLTAVSMIDQRVLWGRRNQEQLTEEPGQMLAARQLFSGFTTELSAWQDVFNEDLRICGHSDRWVCLQSSTQVEMVDLLTGQNLWSLKIPAESHLAFATESCVFLSPRTSGSGGEPLKAATCLNRVDGTPRESAFSPAQLQQTMLATDDELIVWESPGSEPGGASLNWMNSTTGATRHRLPLTDMLNCQFMDARTLVSMTSTGTFEVIDLLTAEKQVVRFVADVVNNTTPEEKTTPDYLVNSVVVADPLNYYVLPVPGQRTRKAMEMLRAAGEHNLIPVGKELRAIDRTTGGLRWVYDTRENTAVWFEPAAHPVLLLLDATPRKNKANAPPLMAFPGLVMQEEYRTTVTALTRNSGTILFEHKATSRFPGPGLEFIVTPQQILDLQAYGNRVRFIPETTPTTLP